MRRKLARSARDRGSLATKRGGMTLVEVAVATAIIGIGVTAIMVASTSTTHVNDAGRKLTQATFLAQEIREWTFKLPFSDPEEPDNPPGPDTSEDPQVLVDDIDDLMGVAYSPPRDGQGAAISDMVGWSQTITLTWQKPDDLTQTVTAGTSDFINVRLVIHFNSREILTTNWLINRRQDE